MSGARRELAVAGALAAVVGVTAWVVGVSWVQSAFLASAVVTVGAGFVWLPSRDVVWPQRRRRVPPGTRSEVARLSWVLIGRKGAVTDQAVDRLLTLAERRLARHGVSLTHPGDAGGAERLLGSRAYRVLRGALEDPARPVRYSAFVRCVAAVEQLARHRPAAPAAASPSTPEHRT